MVEPNNIKKDKFWREHVIFLQELPSDITLKVMGNKNIPENNTIRKDLLNILNHILDTALTPRQAFVLRMKYGIGGSEHTYAAIGKHLNLTVERCRQLYMRGMQLIRLHLQNFGIYGVNDIVNGKCSSRTLKIRPTIWHMPYYKTASLYCGKNLTYSDRIACDRSEVTCMQCHILYNRNLITQYLKQWKAINGIPVSSEYRKVAEALGLRLCIRMYEHIPLREENKYEKETLCSDRDGLKTILNRLYTTPYTLGKELFITIFKQVNTADKLFKDSVEEYRGFVMIIDITKYEPTVQVFIYDMIYSDPRKVGNFKFTKDNLTKVLNWVVFKQKFSDNNCKKFLAKI